VLRQQQSGPAIKGADGAARIRVDLTAQRGRIFQIAVPGSWTSGPFLDRPAKCESEPKSRTAP
jgi:hypothetical protein